MKYLSIDYGTKKIGLATSDDAGRMAFPYQVIPTEGALSRIKNICVEEKVDTIIIGESRNLSGVPNPVMKAIEKFAIELSEATNLPIEFEPEIFTSRAAGREFGQDENLDARAAALLLDTYLKRHLGL